MGQTPPRHEPSPEEIAQAKADIQRRWSRREERLRRGDYRDPVEVPEVAVREVREPGEGE